MCSADLTQTAAGPQSRREPGKQAVTASPGRTFTPVTVEATSEDLARLSAGQLQARRTCCFRTPARNNHRQSGTPASSATRCPHAAPRTRPGRTVDFAANLAGRPAASNTVPLHNAKKVLGFQTKPTQLFALHARGLRATGPPINPSPPQRQPNDTHQRPSTAQKHFSLASVYAPPAPHCEYHNVRSTRGFQKARLQSDVTA